MVLHIGSASAVELEDGLYNCTIGSFFLGQIRIENNMFSGPAFDQKFGESYPFEVTDAGTINWGGPLGGITADGNTVVSTVLGKAGDQIGFDITIQNSRGNFQTISCSPE